MKLFKYYHFLLIVLCVSLLGYITPSLAASSSPHSIGFRFCLDRNCSQSKINFSACGKNSKEEDGQCICLDGFVGDGKNCLKPTCKSGTYSIVDKKGIEHCEICPEGYYCQKGIKQECPDDSYSEAGASTCEECPDDTYSEPGTNTCCPNGTKYNKDKKECVFCTEGQSCNCPQNTPYSDGNGACVECLSNENCPSGFCSNYTCCPQNSSTLLQKGTPLNNGCYCLSGYEPNEEGEGCVLSDCSQVENSSPNGQGDKTSLDGCFCNITHPHWQNGRCMRAKSCTVLMEKYGFRKGIDFREDYTKDDQTFLNTIHVLHSFRTPSNMDLTGCNLVVDGEFQNAHKLVVDSLYINFSNFIYHEIGFGKNIGTIVTKGMTASRFINTGTIIASEATINFGYLENKGSIYADSIYELNNGSSIIKNWGNMTISKDFLFGSLSEDGYIQNTGKIIVGGDWDSNTIFNWDKIIVHGKMNKDNIEIHNEGTITAEEQ